MGWSLRLSWMACLLLNCMLFANSFNHSSVQLSCHDDERSALLQFKQSFVIDKFASVDEGAYPKVLSWKSEEESSNCCFWDGVECDEKTGHVIGLILNSSCLYGSVDSNSSLFRLVHFQKLNLADNHFNYSLIPPAIGQFSRLTYLDLSDSRFYGQIPCEISHLPKLTFLDLAIHYDINYPSKSVTQLTNLSLGEKHLSGQIPSCLGNLTQLDSLDLSRHSLSGYIPSSFQKLTKLTLLGLTSNQITGPIPTWIGNLTQLVCLYLHHNKLHGLLPHSLSKLMNLQLLFVCDNNLNGTVEFDMFFNMRSLVDFDLGQNNLSLLFGERSINATTSKFMSVGLASCNLSKFPYFLRYQNELEFLDLADNKIHGEIPKWIWNTSVETLAFFKLKGNLLVDFRQPSLVYPPWINLWHLDISFNMLQGQLPIPPNSIRYYYVSNNRLTGEISLTICKLSYVRLLDFSSNNFSGLLPQCLGKLNSLTVLNLRNNSFHGPIPQLCTHEADLEMMDLSDNQFEGKLPQSLAACVMLEYLDLANNQLVDVFPSWLGTLPELKLLSLRHNWFHGVIRKPKQDLEFSKLRVIDISNNNFTGDFPSKFILFLNSMKTIKVINSRYMEIGVKHQDVQGNLNLTIFYHYRYSTTIVNKGVERYYPVIQENFAYVDFSCNKFNGEIPQAIGNLKALRSLNLSFNNLTGGIPSSLGNLKELESLDLSNNKLSGEIPPELTQLTFLQSFDVSRNNLTGLIPQGSQFHTFDNVSFEGNPGLCGDPLSKKCEDSKVLPEPPLVVEENDDSGSQIDLDWKFVLAGCISGFVVGVALGDMVITKRKRWFPKTFRRILRNEIRQQIN